jgi:hypothetical protein
VRRRLAARGASGIAAIDAGPGVFFVKRRFAARGTSGVELLLAAAGVAAAAG